MKRCESCGRFYTPYPPQRTRQHYCSTCMMTRRRELSAEATLQYMREQQEMTASRASRNYARWSQDEDRLIVESWLTDAELALQLGRSLRALIDRRARLSKHKLAGPGRRAASGKLATREGAHAGGAESA